MNIVVIGRGTSAGARQCCGVRRVLIAAVNDGAPVFCRFAVPGEV